MLLTPENLREQTRGLWHRCFPTDSEEFLDLYFEHRYTHERNVCTVRENRVAGALQVLPFVFRFAGAPISVGYISGLCTDPDCRKTGIASALLREALVKLRGEGALLSLLIPGNEKLRRWYEREEHGNYRTVAHRLEVDVTPAVAVKADPNLDILAETESESELWHYYHTFGGRHDYEVKLDEAAFRTALRTHRLEGGQIVVARRRRKVVGFALALREGELLKSGKRSTKHFHAKVRFLLTTAQDTMRQLHRRIAQLFGVQQVVQQGGCPAHGFKDAQPYAMARVVDVRAFLTFIVQVFPGLQLSFGVEGDQDFPENNGYYEVQNGTWRILHEPPSTMVTPGDLAALFLSAQPVLLPMLLDE